MDKLWHVGYDGMAMPVWARTKEFARQKASAFLESKGYRISRITVTRASNGYEEWVKMNNIEVLH